MRKFNYTGRKRIRQRHVSIRLQGEPDVPPIIDVDINLEAYEFPAEAHVVLEAQRKTRFMKENLGPIKSHIRRYHLPLPGFDDAMQLVLRIKVVNLTTGKLLGVANRLSLQNKDGRIDKNQASILPVASADLSGTGVLWRIDYSGGGPVLQVERELGPHDTVTRTTFFKAFILPAAMKDILRYYLSHEVPEDLSDTEDFAVRWIIFAEKIGAGPLDSNEEDREEWIDRAVRNLARQINARETAIKEFSS